MAPPEKRQRTEKTHGKGEDRDLKEEGEDERGEEEEEEDEEEAGSSDEELELAVDEDGRVGVDGVEKLAFSFRNLQCVFQGADVAVLRQDCEAAFTARSAQKGDSYSAGDTFWVPASGPWPQTALEALALSVFQHHASSAAYDPMKSGAEWWTLAIEVGDDVGWHWDRDYGLEEDTGFKLHPHIATVTYLSDIGAPTVVLEGTEGGCDEKWTPISVAQISYPRVGKHISFDGRWLHGSPADLVFREISPAGVANQKRYTLLVNVWLNHKPVGATKFPSKAGILSPANTADDSVQWATAKEPTCLQVTPAGHVGLERYTWLLKAGDEGEDCEDGDEVLADSTDAKQKTASESPRRVVLRLPVPELRKATAPAKCAESCAHSFTLQLAPGLAWVGGAAASHNSSEPRAPRLAPIK